MKKAIAALLASFVGLFGYQIVDKTIEARVDNLEYQVSSQQEEIESLHRIGKYSVSLSSSTEFYSSSNVSSQFETSSLYEDPSLSESISSVEYPVLVTVGYVFPIKKLQTKYMYRVYSNGAIRYVPTGLAPVCTTAPNATLPDDYDEYYLYVNSVEAVVTSIEDKTESYTYYDADYTLKTGTTTKKLVSVTVTVSGKTDPIFAGKKVTIYPQIYRSDSDDGLYNITSNSTVIEDNGSFEIKTIYEGESFYIQENCGFNLYSVSIS